MSSSEMKSTKFAREASEVYFVSEVILRIVKFRLTAKRQT